MKRDGNNLLAMVVGGPKARNVPASAPVYGSTGQYSGSSQRAFLVSSSDLLGPDVP